MSHHTAHPSARPAPFDATRGTSIDEEAAASWAALARLLSGRPWCRESRDANPRRRGSYLLRWQRNITDRPPAVPAAVPIYDTTTGTTRVFVVDLDTSRGGRDVVRRDASTITGLVQAAGGRVITDESPTGGIHVYIPLAQAVPFHDARDLALALARRLPSMDPSPNQNLQAGLIRPPGSRPPRRRVSTPPRASQRRCGHRTVRQPTRGVARPKCRPRNRTHRTDPIPTGITGYDQRRRRRSPSTTATWPPGPRPRLPLDRSHRHLAGRPIQLALRGWRNTSRSLTQLADQLGITETIRALVMRHRDERRRYRQALRIPEREHLTVLPGPELPPWRLQEPPPDDEQTAMELLERVLGAHLIQVA